MVEEQTRTLRLLVQASPRPHFFYEIFLICKINIKISVHFPKIVQFNMLKWIFIHVCL